MTQTSYLCFATLEGLLDQYESPLELARHLDHVMLTQVAILNYEPEQLKSMLPAYESMWMLRNLILNQVTPSNP